MPDLPPTATDLTVRKHADALLVEGNATIWRDQSGLALARSLDARLAHADAASDPPPAPVFVPFANESATVSFAGMTVENRLDRLELYGRAMFTQEASVHRVLTQLRALIGACVAQLQAAHAAGQLPAHVAIAPTDMVDNPFLSSPR